MSHGFLLGRPVTLSCNFYAWSHWSQRVLRRYAESPRCKTSQISLVIGYQIIHPRKRTNMTASGNNSYLEDESPIRMVIFKLAMLVYCSVMCSCGFFQRDFGMPTSSTGYPPWGKSKFSHLKIPKMILSPCLLGRCQKSYPRKTNMTMKNPQFEDAFSYWTCWFSS